MSASHTLLKILRQIHLYVGVFIAPALLFFAFTGGLQVFSLHESSRGSDYKPPAWLAISSQLHKNQTTVMREHPPHPPRPMEADSRQSVEAANPAATLPIKPDAPKPPARSPLPLKIFSAFVSLGLFVSTLIGIYMAYRHTRKRGLVVALLLAGIVLPVVLALI